MVLKSEIKDSFSRAYYEKGLDDLLKVISHYHKKTQSTDKFLVWIPSYMDLAEYINDEILSSILKSPNEGFEAIMDFIEEEVKPELDDDGEDDDDGDRDVIVGLKDIPSPYIKEVRELREEDIGRYVGLRGVIGNISEILHRPLEIPFKCGRCGEITPVNQEDGYKMIEPYSCLHCDKKSSKTNFKLITDKGRYIDFQELNISERQRDLQAGEQPRSKKAIIQGYLVDHINPGKEVILYGIYEARFKNGSLIPKTYLDVKYIEVLEKNYSGELSQEARKRVEKLSKDPEISEKITDSIASAIKGLREEKQSIALQLFGGVRKNESSRGDIHILLAGDPETGKSQVLDQVSRIAPKGILGSGRGVTGVGLTGAANQEEIAGESHWVAQPGILPLADGGLAAIDEFDKMRSEDRKSIHRAMEQQDVHIDKATIHQTLNSRCSVLAAANPRDGKFETDRELINELELRPELLSRFDYIWIIKGQRKREEQEDIANHILKMHQEYGKKENNPNYQPQGEFLPPISLEDLRNYISVGRDLKPVLPEKVLKKIKDFYMKLCEEIEVGPRTLEAIIRTAEASAKLHHREEVTLTDVDIAIRLKKEQLDRTGENSVKYLMMGHTTAEGTLKEMTKSVIKELEKKSPDGVEIGDIALAMEGKGYSKEEIKRELDRLRKNGEIMTTTNGRVKRA